MTKLSFNEYLENVEKLDINSKEYEQLTNMYNDYILTDFEMCKAFELMLDNKKKKLDI